MLSKDASILVVDDEVDTCRNLTDILTDLGYDVDTAHDGPSALEVIAAYNARTTWDELLTRHGWHRLSGSEASVGHWQRPGKTDPGGSATTNYGGSDKLCVFSTTPGLKVTVKKGKAPAPAPGRSSAWWACKCRG